MFRGQRLAAAVLLLSIFGAQARSQYNYPGGYGGYGWGGWGSGTTVQGSVAAGMGAFARGAGIYNVETAQARSINADTAMRWNQYVWQSQQNVNRLNYEKTVRERKIRDRARDEMALNLRNNPTEDQIAKGEALNAALDEINNPKNYLRAYRTAEATVPGVLIRDIPFVKASAAITMSFDELRQLGVPDALKVDDFREDRENLKAIADRLRAQDQAEGKFEPATIREAQAAAKALRLKVEAKYPQGTPQRRESERFVKGLMGLLRILDTPAINVLLAGVDKRPEVTLGDLLTFMKTYNLRFGVAEGPRQREVYDTLYPLLVRLRDEISPAPPSGYAAAPAPPPDRNAHPGEFFEKMPFEHLEGGAVPPPPAPAPR